MRARRNSGSDMWDARATMIPSSTYPELLYRYAVPAGKYSESLAASSDSTSASLSCAVRVAGIKSS